MQSNGGFGDITGSTAGDIIDTDQSNTNSPQTAEVLNPIFTNSIGTQMIDGTNDQILNSDQKNIDSKIGSTVSGSTACLNP